MTAMTGFYPKILYLCIQQLQNSLYALRKASIKTELGLNRRQTLVIY